MGEKKKRVKIATSKQLAKDLKSGHEAAKLENEEFVKAFPFENNSFQAASQNVEIRR